METLWLPIVVLLGTLIVFLVSGLWLGVGLSLVAIICYTLFTDLPMTGIITRIMFSQSTSYTLMAIPMFVLMGQILFFSGIVGHLYKGLTPWVSRLPGKLLQTNVISCTLMSAITGSTVATAATISSIAVPTLRERGYATGPVVGTIGGASLGLLIPPSLYFIIYGMLTEQSISRLYTAGLLPGLMTQLMFMIFVGALALLRPDLTPGREPVTKRDLLLSLPRILPTIGLIALVLGMIYLGISTVTEAAAIGVLGALILMIGFRRFNLQDIKAALFNTVRISGMIIFIMMAAMVLSNIIGYLGIPTQLARMVTESSVVSPGIVFLFIVLMYLFLGTFLDGMAMVLLTLPVVFPVIIALGYDPIWFGVVLALMIEIAQITPPLGFGIYVLQSSTGLPVTHIMKWQLPFVSLMLLAVLLLYFFPQIALYLPSTMH